MTNKVYPRLSVENFGPIKSGTVELKPLTIFIGPNNSGKSYMATLAYALLRVLSSPTRSLAPNPFLPRIYQDPSKLTSPAAMQWLQQLQSFSIEPTRFEDFPKNVQEMITFDSREVSQLLGASIEAAILEYFSVQQVSELIRASDQSMDKLNISLRGSVSENNLINIIAEPPVGAASVTLPEPKLSDRTFFSSDGHRLRQRGDLQGNGAAIYYREWFLQELWMQVRHENGLSYAEPYYLPAARSGILQGYQAFAAIAFAAIRWNLGREEISIPAYHGVTGDFLEELSRKVPRAKDHSSFGPMSSTLHYLEERVFQGQIKLGMTSASHPRITYAAGGTTLSLDRVSSMVAELAPLALWIQDLVPGDMLFIDEPEAHLHPENQRHIATVLARLSGAGVRVLATSHSSLILHQISNHLIASKLPPEKRIALGYTDDDLLSADDVAVYLFDIEEDGTVIKPVEIDPEFGIDEEEFIRVFQAIGNETYDLSVAAQTGSDMAEARS